MLAIFCLRLATGMTAALLLLSPAQVNPRFYRTHFLTVLGLTTVAALFARDTAGAWEWLALTAALVLAFGGSLVWSLEGAPGGRALIGLTTAALLTALGLDSRPLSPDACPGWLLANELTSAALLGAATTAMLTGHSYLIAPAMSLTPLRRLLAALAVTTLLRLAVAAAALWS